jgi:serine O-acetyltransferase
MHRIDHGSSSFAPAADTPWDVEDVAAALHDIRRQWRSAYGRDGAGLRGVNFPSRAEVERLMDDIVGALFPLRLGPPDLRADDEEDYVKAALESGLHGLLHQVELELDHHAGGRTQEASDKARAILRPFARALPNIRRSLDLDVEAAFKGDPAAKSVDEALLCSPGVLAMIHHRIAHRLYQEGAPLVARIVSEIAHSRTGVDIHPGATIGPSIFIDHGAGVVIGETAEIGANVRIYQGVTLGALSFRAEGNGALVKGQPRHPILEDRVVVYAGATILGRITVGADSVIGGGVWLTHSVPPASRLSQPRPTAFVGPTGT